jgi:NADH dehydrogenase/NADH:ubiquinone oxidoreductase subunit G
MVKKAREGVMEFLLINHPLDCPICDQGGECDLQDQAMAYGFGGSRFEENKRAVEEKYLGPLIKTAMNRCIHCTRCVRFMTEVAGVEELGAIGRGEDMEITTYLERGMVSELSANVNDLCPVGALTHRPWAFIYRPWELRKTESIDVMDAVGSNIRADARGREVLRILPRNNDAVNEEWISDKTRYVADGLRTQRLDRPYIRKGGRLEPVSWDEALGLVADKLKAARPERIAAIAGDLAGAEEMFALGHLLVLLGSPNFDCRQDGAKLDPRLGRASYLFNTTIEGIERADAILLVGTNPRLEASLVNARIRKDGRLEPAGWDEALAAVAGKLKSAKPERIGAIVGDLAGAEEMFALGDLFRRLGSRNLDCRQDGAKLDSRLGRASYLFNASIAGIERADAILLVGTNPRLEASVLNIRIRKRWRLGGLAIGLIGERADLTYPYDYLGAGPQTLRDVAEGKQNFAAALREAKHPLVIVGAAAAARADGAAVLATAARIALAAGHGKEVGAAAFNVLNGAASRGAGLDLRFVPGEGGLDVAAMLGAAGKGQLDALYLLGADEIDMSALGKAFVIYQGSHGDAGAQRADVVLPGSAYTEKSATYVNVEGRAQMASRAAFPPGDAKEDWAIVRALSAHVGHTLPYDNLPALRAAMYKEAPALARLDAVEPAWLSGVEALAARGGALGSEPFGLAVRDFYLTNPIARASAVMAELSALAKGVQQGTTGTHG